MDVICRVEADDNKVLSVLLVICIFVCCLNGRQKWSN